jgi:hypothetical protein
MSRTQIDPLEKLLNSASAEDLRAFIKLMAKPESEPWEEEAQTAAAVRRECIEFLRKRVKNAVPGEALDAETVWDLWAELEPDLSDLDEFGGGDHDVEDHVGKLLYEMAGALKKKRVPLDDRRSLLDEILSYIRRGNAGMDDALYEVAYAACYDNEDLRNLATRFESLGRDWPRDHAMRIYRQIGDGRKYLEIRLPDLKYGNDYHDLATFYWESGARDKAIDVARDGLKKGEGAMEQLRGFLSERAKETGDRTAYLDLQFAQATDRHLTHSRYEAFKQLCNEKEWPVYEPKMLKAIEQADGIDQLEIRLFREEFDVAIQALSKVFYPHSRYDDDRVFTLAAKLESRFPNEALAFYRKGVGNVLRVSQRTVYAEQAQAALRMRHVWVDVLKNPEAWRTFAKNLKTQTLKKPAFQEEFSRVIPEWKTL